MLTTKQIKLNIPHAHKNTWNISLKQYYSKVQHNSVVHAIAVQNILFCITKTIVREVLQTQMSDTEYSHSGVKKSPY